MEFSILELTVLSAAGILVLNVIDYVIKGL